MAKCAKCNVQGVWSVFQETARLFSIIQLHSYTMLPFDIWGILARWCQSWKSLRDAVSFGSCMRFQPTQSRRTSGFSKWVHLQSRRIFGLVLLHLLFLHQYISLDSTFDKLNQDNVMCWISDIIWQLSDPRVVFVLSSICRRVDCVSTTTLKYSVFMVSWILLTLVNILCNIEI